MTLPAPARQARVGGPEWQVLLLAGCLLAPMPTGATNAAEVTDAAGRRVEIADASRIVSVGSAVTEILYALGRENQIVAVDSTSLYPKGAQAKPSVGYMRQLSAEGVLGLNPSLVLASKDSGPKETMAVLSAAKIPLVLIPERYSGDGVIEKIGLIAAAADAKAQGACLARAVRDDLAALADLRRRIAKPVKVMFVLSLMNGRPMVAGLNTAANGIIELAGATNAISEYSGYKQASDEAVIAAAPDVILVMQRPGATMKADDVFRLSAFAATPAAARRAFVSMDGLYLLGFGPRTAEAARDLAIALYPDIGELTAPQKMSAHAAECH